MPQETADLQGYAVLWESSGVDNYNKPTVLAPVEIRVRWVRQRQESLDPNGRPIAIMSTVYVGRSIPIGSLLWEGRLADLPSPVTGIEEVASAKETPDTKYQNIRRALGLVRYGDTLPTVIS